MTPLHKLPRKEPTVSRAAFRARHQLSFEGTISKTKQSMKDECDINKILKRGAQTGMIDHVNRAQGSIQDLSGAVDYKTGLDLINAARDSFMALPAAVRDEFDNSPGKFLEFADNPENRDKMIMLGLMEKAAPDEALADKLIKGVAKQLGIPDEPDETTRKKTVAGADADTTETGDK